jgi:NADH dehydrogenase (ubiquinone) Fe-S protein 3
MKLQQIGTYITNCLPKHVSKFTIYKDQLTLYVPPTSLLPTIQFLKLHQATQFTQLVDMTAVDYPTKKERFELVYHLLSIPFNQRITLKSFTNESTPIPSVTSVFKGANWMEREVWDMFGIFFTGHVDLRRILTDYGFQGHPLRKDFPLTGFVEVQYDDSKKRVVVEPLELAQAFRMFDGYLSQNSGLVILIPFSCNKRVIR